MHGPSRSHCSCRRLPRLNWATTRRLPRVLWRRETRPMPAASDVQHAGPLLILANIAVSSGDNDRAQALYDESIEVVGVPEKHGAWALSFRWPRACASCGRDFDGRARRHPRRWRCVRSSKIHAGSPGVSTCSRGCWPPEATPTERPDYGARQTRCCERVGGSLNPMSRWIRDRYIQPVKTSLGPGSFETARAEGRAMPPVPGDRARTGSRTIRLR